MGPALAFQSALLGRSCVIFALMTSRLMTCSMVIPAPRRRRVIPSPPAPDRCRRSVRSGRRSSASCAVMLSNPIRPSTTPMQAISKALAIEPCVRNVQNHEADTIELKYSAGPNAKSPLASDGAISINATSENVPAMNEPSAEMPSAGRPALLRHLMPIDTGHHRRGFAWNVDGSTWSSRHTSSRNKYPPS